MTPTLFSNISHLSLPGECNGMGYECYCDIKLSSNASGVPFEYLQYNRNKKERACKARVNERRINQSIKKVSIRRLFKNARPPF
jgi:hypothetical protein